MHVFNHAPARRLVRLTTALTGVAIAGLAMIPVASAAATAPAPTTHPAPNAVPRVPSGCASGSDGETYAETYCFYGTGSFRIVITCTTGIIRYGSWEAAGGGITSYAKCPTNTFLVDFSREVD